MAQVPLWRMLVVQPSIWTMKQGSLQILSAVKVVRVEHLPPVQDHGNCNYRFGLVKSSFISVSNPVMTAQ